MYCGCNFNHKSHFFLFSLSMKKARGINSFNGFIFSVAIFFFFSILIFLMMGSGGVNFVFL